MKQHLSNYKSFYITLVSQMLIVGALLSMTWYLGVPTTGHWVWVIVVVIALMMAVVHGMLLKYLSEFWIYLGSAIVIIVVGLFVMPNVAMYIQLLLFPLASAATAALVAWRRYDFLELRYMRIWSLGLVVGGLMLTPLLIWGVLNVHYARTVDVIAPSFGRSLVSEIESGTDFPASNNQPAESVIAVYAQSKADEWCQSNQVSNLSVESLCSEAVAEGIRLEIEKQVLALHGDIEGKSVRVIASELFQEKMKTALNAYVLASILTLLALPFVLLILVLTIVPLLTMGLLWLMRKMGWITLYEQHVQQQVLL